MYKIILLSIDGSENSRRATEHAINIANVNGGNIIVMFVIEPYNPRLPVFPITRLPMADENYYEEVEMKVKK